MDFDKPLQCTDCTHHEKPTCVRIIYDDHYNPIGPFWFWKSDFEAHPRGMICNKFELWRGYNNSPSYKGFTLDDYIIYHGIEKLEHKVLTKTGFNKRVNNEYMFEFLRNHDDGRYGYIIRKDGKELKHYRCLGWDLAFADWLDICRANKHTSEYLTEVKEAFLTGAVLLFLKMDNKGWYVMRYKDWFEGNLFKEEGVFNVKERQWYYLPKNYGTYKLNYEVLDGLSVLRSD